MGKLLWYVFVWPFRTIQQRWGTRWATVSYVAAFILLLTLIGSVGGSDTAATKVAEPEAAEAADDSATNDTDDDATTQEAAAEPQVNTAAIERQAVRTLAAIDRVAQGRYFKALPREVRTSYRALERLLGSQIKITVREANAVEQRIDDLRFALTSGDVRRAVKRMKAKERAAREKERREAEAEAAAQEEASNCDPNYSGCLVPNASDYDCDGGSGDGPLYTGQVEIRGRDPHGLDADGDGIGCEPY